VAAASADGVVLSSEQPSAGSEPGEEATGPVSLAQDQLDLLAEIESRDNIFPEIDFRVYLKL
jgi:hypothetical protein